MPLADDVQVAFNRVRELQPQLDAAADAVTNNLRRLEELLRGARVRISAAVSITHLDADDAHDVILLRWGKKANKWQLLLHYESDGPDGAPTDLSQPVLAGSLWQRKLAARGVSHLVRAIAKSMAAQVAELNEAADQVAAVCDAVTSPPADIPTLRHPRAAQ